MNSRYSERCAIQTICGKQHIVPCRILASTIGVKSPQFIFQEFGGLNDKPTHTMLAVDLVDATGRRSIAECTFCPFCGAKIVTDVP